MSQYFYRLTLYKTDSEILTPKAGAPHTDQFKVSSVDGVSGFKPYISKLSPDFGTFKLPDVTYDTGNLTVTLLDKRLGTDNLVRWVTAFFGAGSSAEYLPTLAGYKAVLEESVNGGSWTLYFVGRVSDVSLTSKGEYAISIRNGVTDFKTPIFKSGLDYSIPYYAPISLLPIGLARDITTNLPEVPIRSIGQTLVSVPPVRMEYRSPAAFPLHSWVRELTLESTPEARRVNGARVDLKATSELFSRSVRGILPTVSGSYSELSRTDDARKLDVDALHRVLIELPNGQVKPAIYLDSLFGNSGLITSLFSSLFLSAGKEFTEGPVNTIRICEIPPNAKDYAQRCVFATDLPAGASLANRRVKVRVVPNNVYRDQRIEGQALKLPFYLSNVHVATVIRDLCNGKFGASGAKLMDFNSSSLAYLESGVLGDSLRGTWKIEKDIEAIDFLEKQCLRPFGLGYTFTPALSASVPVNQLKVYPLNLNYASRSAVIDESDVLASDAIGWTQEQPYGEVTYTYYVDTVDFTNAGGSVTSAISQNFKTLPIPSRVVRPSIDVYNISKKKLSIDFTPFRSLQSNTKDLDTKALDANLQYAVQQVAKGAYYDRFVNGVSTISFKTRRNAAYEGVSVGDFVWIDTSVIPNSNIQQRGGTRLVQVTSKVPFGPVTQWKFVDSGLTASLATPNITYNSVSSSVYAVNFSVSASSAGRFQIDVIGVDPSIGTQPVQADLGWRTIGEVVNTGTGSQTYELDYLRSRGKRLWLRARMVGGALPSAYRVATTSRIIAPLTPPSSILFTGVTTKQARVSWTNGDVSSSVAMYISNPSGSTLEYFTTLPATTNQFTLKALDQNVSQSYTVALGHVDSFGNSSTLTSSSFSATGSATALPSMSRFVVYRG